LTDNHRPISRGRRVATGLVVVVASLAVAAVVAGVGFAGGSITAAQYQYGKVTICHHTHSKKHPFVTIRVGANAVAAHKRHGDTEGACATAKAKDKHGKGHAKGKGHDGGNSKGKGHDGGKPKGSDDTKTTTTSSTPQPSNDGHGKSDDHGNGKGKGKK
jgi:hypothetical protein